MKIYYYISIILFNTITFVSLSEFECPKGEIHDTCGSACPPTCSKPTINFCTFNCVSGCFCLDDKVRDENTGKCVDLKTCTCPKGEYFTLCGSACPPTCSKPVINQCTDNCVAGCFCPDNQVRDENTGKCVDLNECTCPKGEEFKTCGSACPPTCSKPHINMCTDNCVAGCFCPDHQVRDENTGQCVDLNECTCPKGEEFNICGSACPATCSKPIINQCTYNCVSGCFCPNNKVRDENTGQCVDLNSCTCPENEEFNICGTACPQTCKDKVPPACTKQCAPGCFCKGNKVRQSITGKCVDPQDCIKCRDNEEYSSYCVSGRTCENPHNDTCIRKSGCTCKKGLVWDEEIGECVPIEECPQTEPTGCKEGEIFMECGPACLATCSNPAPENCDQSCKRGCFCPPGQIRNDFNNYLCINRTDCPKSN